ncbi:hypothetical protein [Aminipila sp.]|uniref:hypothetical protein n=1 Tax=Aminipila sp. TaxID=2060095 RepID=UPI00289DC9CF|nr:hypothetical protein [Aminipila sp.]
MKIRTKRILMLLLLFASVIWDCLCVLNVLPLGLFTVSVVAVGGYSFMVIFVPLFFPNSAQARENSTYIHDLTKRERQMSGATIGLAFAWIVTLIACIVYPL